MEIYERINARYLREQEEWQNSFNNEDNKVFMRDQALHFLEIAQEMKEQGNPDEISNIVLKLLMSNDKLLAKKFRRQWQLEHPNRHIGLLEPEVN